MEFDEADNKLTESSQGSEGPTTHAIRVEKTHDNISRILQMADMAALNVPAKSDPRLGLRRGATAVIDNLLMARGTKSRGYSGRLNVTDPGAISAKPLFKRARNVNMPSEQSVYSFDLEDDLNEPYTFSQRQEKD